MWYLLQIQGLHLSQQKGPNELFRKLSKSKSAFYGYTNKEFFRKYVKGGFYRNNLINGNLDYDFYLYVQPKSDFRNFELNLKMRLKKLGVVNLQIEKIDTPQNIPNFHPKFFQPFGEYYGKKGLVLMDSSQHIPRNTNPSYLFHPHPYS
jgi:hypothetical protein